MTRDLILEKYTVDENGCWNFTGTRHNSGYGYTGRHAYAHRYFYARLVGRIPAGLTIDHLCMNKLCVNPEHLEAVTLAENIRRWHAKHPPFTHCHNGHDLSIQGKSPDGRCRRCNNERKARYRAKQRQEASA